MANTCILAKDGSTVWMKILRVLKHRSIGRVKKRMWYAEAADPAVDANSHAAYPVRIGDFAYRVDSDEAFICSVAPAASTAATFIQLHA